MKIVFMGTPDYAAASLEALIRAGYEVTAVVTQPDRAKGRSGALQFSPVKECAVSHEIPVLQPERIRRPEEFDKLKEYPADLYVVAAFGQILPKEILEYPPLGCINVHASLLPKYRGASPIQRVLLDGESETGITIMQMDEGIDTGDILYQKKITIDIKETFETLHDRLAVLGGEALVEALALLEKGELPPKKQNNAIANYAHLIKKEDGELDLTESAGILERKVRAMNPWPGAFTYLGGKLFKVYAADVIPETELCSAAAEHPAGTVLEACRDRLTVRCGRGALILREVQIEGKKRMDVSAFLLSGKVSVGDRFGRG